MQTHNKPLIDISTKTFLQVTVLLLVLLAVTIILTYIVPAGSFGTLPDGSVDYSTYQPIEGQHGIPLWKGILAPVLVFFSADGPRLIMLSLFLLILTAAFQTMSDVGGIHAMIDSVTGRFAGRRFLVISIITLLFMCFGSFLGLFEEMLTMLPIMALFCLNIGFDSFTGFLISLVACGFGFASAITNPFTVLLACEIIGANPMEHILYRVLIFLVMYLLLECFIYLYIRKLSADPSASYTLEHDRRILDHPYPERTGDGGSAVSREPAAQASGETAALSGSPDPLARSASPARTRWICSVFLLVSLILIIVCSLTPVLSDYTIVILTAYFLIFGILSGVLCTGSFRTVFRSFLFGIKGGAPTIVFIALSASIKYVFDEGHILPTFAEQINRLAGQHNIFVIALTLFGIVLLLEFFISSSTAKAILVMGLLSIVNVGLTDQMSVLIYTFADGYTNVLFPTSPVLLIGLSMIELDYLKWVRKSAPLFLVTLALVLLFLFIGIIIGY